MMLRYVDPLVLPVGSSSSIFPERLAALDLLQMQNGSTADRQKGSLKFCDLAGHAYSTQRVFGTIAGDKEVLAVL